MKRKVTLSYLIFLILFVMFPSCISSQSLIPVKGIGTSRDKDFDVSDFQVINVSNGFDVVLVQGNSENLTLTAQENLFEFIRVKVDQGILKIYAERNIMATQPLKATISFKNIDDLKVSGGGDVICETPVNVPKLGVNISGGGDLNTIIDTEELNCHITGGGDAEIGGKIKNYYLDLSGGGDVKSDVNANVISCKISGGGDLTFNSKEKASDATIHIDGGGDVNAGSLSTNITSFNVSGGSDIHVNALKELTGYISGGGNVYYSGSPEKISVDARGGSEVRKE